MQGKLRVLADAEQEKNVVKQIMQPIIQVDTICMADDNDENMKVYINVRDPKDLIEITYSVIKKISVNNFCFSGTFGELAFRLISALTETNYSFRLDPTKAKAIDIMLNEQIIFNEALSTFKGVFMGWWFLKEIQGNDNILSTILISKDPCQNQAKAQSIDIESILNVKFETLLLNSIRNRIDCVWVAIDGTIAGIGLPNHLAINKTVAIIDSAKYPRAKEILNSLVWLENFNDGAVSYPLVENLRFGATNNHTCEHIQTIIGAAPFCRKPSDMFIRMQTLKGLKATEFGLEYGDIVKGDIVIAEMLISNSLYAAWGREDRLIHLIQEYAKPKDIIWAKLSVKNIYMLFGPPSYILAPFPPYKVIPLEKIFSKDAISPKILKTKIVSSHDELGKYLKEWNGYLLCGGDEKNKYNGPISIKLTDGKLQCMKLNKLYNKK